MPIIQNGLIIQNETINERITQFIEENFENSPKLTLITGFCQSESDFYKALDRFLPKEVINKIFIDKSFALSVKASYDYTASKMKDMITLTKNVVNYLEKRAFTIQDKTEFTIGIGENLEKNELVFFCLVGQEEIF